MVFWLSYRNLYYILQKGGDNILNQVVLVGRLVRDLQVNTSDSGRKISTLTLAVPRSFKNQEGTYDTDFIDCTVWDVIAVNTSTYCKKGDVVGVKGRIQSRVIEENDNKKTVLEVIAEKVTFLTSKKEEKEDE